MVIRAFLFFILFSQYVACAEDLTPNPQNPDLFAQQETSVPAYLAPPSFVNGVSTIFGSFHDSQIDLIVPGVEPLHFRHDYSSKSIFRSSLGDMAMAFNYPNYLADTDLKPPMDIVVAENGGSIVRYTSTQNHDKQKTVTFYLSPEVIHKGLTNIGRGLISGRTNLKNSYYTFTADHLGHKKGIWQGYFGDGSSRQYYREESDDPFHGGLNIQWEQKSSGNRLCFDYTHKHGSLKKIELRDASEKHLLSWLKFDGGPYHKLITVTSSNGKTCEYEFDRDSQDILYLEKVTSPDIPTTKYAYEKIYGLRRLTMIRRPHGRFLEMVYDGKGRVTAQKAPSGKEDQKRTIWTFEYKPDDTETKVWDANNHKSVFYYSGKKRLTHIERYTQDEDSHTLYRTERFYWGDREHIKKGKKPQTDEGNLVAKAIFGSDGFVRNSSSLDYDDYGNILTETLYGNLTGKSFILYHLNHLGEPTKTLEFFRRSYTYSDNGFNLKLSQKEDLGPTIRYKYKENSDLLVAQFTCDSGAIKIREFFEYDEDAVLIKKISDNGSTENAADLAGVTERHITTIIPVRGIQDHGVGQPKTIIESYLDIPSQKEAMLERHNFTYDTQGLVKTEEVIDATGSHAYTLQYSYDSHGLLVHKIDAVGRQVRYDYDENFNKIREELIGSGFYTTFEYDCVNRLTQEAQHHSDGTIFTTSYQYDLMGNKTASTDHFGNTTNYRYDDLDRCIEILYPTVTGPDGKQVRPQEKKAYDIYDNVIAETDENGHVTKREYNARKQPVRIMYPDSSEERFEYTLNGTLANKWDRNGTRTAYTYDVFKRVLAARTYDSAEKPLTTITNTYNAFHLVSTCDAMGYTTHFTYDGAGRKIQELKQEGNNFEKTTFEYDALNRLATTKSWYETGSADFIMSSQTFDNLNRVIAEERRDGHGTLLGKTRFTYDIFGNKTRVENFQTLEKIGVVQTLYNSKNLPVTLIDEVGNTTTIAYDFNFRNALGQRALRKSTTDPLGNKTVETYDALSRLESLERYNASQILTAKNTLVYDPAGNKVRDIESDVIQGKVDHDYIIASTYDACARLIDETEQPGTADEKKTRYAYTKAGFLEIISKPDGVQLKHVYDALGRLFDLSSSDNTVHYSYTYDKNNNPLEIYDHVHNLLHSRKYDPWNRLAQDSFPNTLNLQIKYDPVGRASSIVLPDESSLAYQYTNGHLSDVIRFNSSQAEQYRHSYTSVDLGEHVLESHLIGSCGAAAFSYDIKGRPTRITTPSWAEEIPPDGYDKASNLKHLCITDRIGVTNCNFTYDDLYQLTKEDGVALHDYQNDSLANRLACDSDLYTLDSLNKITKTSDRILNYDKNGNLIKKQENSHTTTYHYDALNRLIEAKEEGVFTAEYLYDSLNRRLAKKITTPNGLNDSYLQFIYWGNFEIAAYDANQNPVHFRALGRGRGADVGAAIALELNGATYCPIHDAHGDISELLSLDGMSYETIHYSAFGTPTIYDATGETVELSRSPWLYASKRFDRETGFFHFAKRYYFPELGRWVTPDPLGFADGPNLYAYVHLSPMILFDPYGLEAQDENPTDNASSQEHEVHNDRADPSGGDFWDRMSGAWDSFKSSLEAHRDMIEVMVAFCCPGGGVIAAGGESLIAFESRVWSKKMGFWSRSVTTRGAISLAQKSGVTSQAAQTLESTFNRAATAEASMAARVAEEKNYVSPQFTQKTGPYRSLESLKDAGCAENKMGKHREGDPQYEPEKNRSIFTHPDMKSLIKGHGGEGLPDPEGSVPTAAGYKEIIDFGEPIGDSVNEKTGVRTPTTIGKAHYDSDYNAHVVPTHPDTYWKRKGQ